MSLYQLRTPTNQKDLEQQTIQERIDLLMEKQCLLTGDDYRRCKLSIDYNRRLLKNPKATVAMKRRSYS